MPPLGDTVVTRNEGKKCRIRGNFGKNVENVENKKRPEILVFRVIKTNFAVFCYIGEFAIKDGA